MAALGYYNEPDNLHDPHHIKMWATIAGGAAGNLTVAGVVLGDIIEAVVNVIAASANLASEFAVTAANTINNTGGTNTTGMVLLVVWRHPEHGVTGQ